MKYPQGDADAKIRGDKRNLDYNVGVMQAIVLALDVANAQLDLPFAGDFLHVDSSSTGQISVKFDTAMAAGFPMKTNTLIKDFPYRRVLVSWAAQPGKTVTLWYGYGVNIVPPNQDITTIGSITNPVPLAPTDAHYFKYGDFETTNQRPFVGFASLGAVAANIHEVQIWNPIGSTKTVFVDGFSFQPSAAVVCGLYFSGALFANLSNTYPLSWGSGAASQALCKYQTVVAPTGTRWGSFANANGLKIKFESPVQLYPGTGIHLSTLTVNIGNDVTWFFREY